MAIVKNNNKQLRRRTINVLYLAVLLVLTVSINTRSSRAEFAAPTVNPTNDISSAELRGIWAFDDVNLGYEAWGVGIDTTVTDPVCQAAFQAAGATYPSGKLTGGSNKYPLPNDALADVKDCNGVLYYYKQGQWMRLQPILSTEPTFAINAVAGQMDQAGTLNRLWVVGAHGGVAAVEGFGPTSKLVKQEIEFAYDTKYVGSPPYPPYDPTTADHTKDFYAVGAGQEWGLNVLAGGEKGLFAVSGGGGFVGPTPLTYDCRGEVHGDFGGSCTSPGMTDIKCRGGDHLQYGECTVNKRWLQRDVQVEGRSNPAPFNDSLQWPGGKWENITGVQFTSKYVAYALTSTFKNNAGRYDPDALECQDSVNQIYRLYKIKGTGPNEFNKWTLLREWSGAVNGGCAYGFSYSLRENTIDDGQMVNDFWIATNKGVVKYNEQANSWSLVGASAKPLYSVAAINVRGGIGQNLLYNGNLENWLGQLTFPDTDPQTLPLPNGVNVMQDGWLTYDESRTVADLYGYHNYDTYNNPASPQCQRNNLNIRPSQDVPDPNTYGSKRSLVLEPGLAYYNDTCTGPTFRSGVESSMVRVPMTNTIQGQRFKVKAKIKVEFPDMPAGEEPTLMPYGGIFTTCDGDRWDITLSPKNCSLTNRSHLRVWGNPTVDDAGKPVFKDVEFIVSRQNTQFSDTKRQFMQVRCTASYGAKVTCDDIRVEEITDPPLPAYDRVEVIAVGKEYTSISSDDALAAAPIFTNEKLPSITVVSPTLPPNLNTTFALNAQHVYTAGDNRILYNRTPSTLKGMIWLGTGTHDNKGLGYASASCVNNRGNVSYYNGSVEGTGITLCQRNPESYGLVLDTTNNVMTGRAWFGKNIVAGENDDKETADFGKCVNPPENIGQSNDPRMQPSSTPYYLNNYCGFNNPLPSTGPPDTCALQDPQRTCASDGSNCADVTTCPGYPDPDESCDLPPRYCVINSGYSCVSDVNCNNLINLKCWGYKGLYYDNTSSSGLSGGTPWGMCLGNSYCANWKYGLCDTRVHLCWASNERDYDSDAIGFDPASPSPKLLTFDQAKDEGRYQLGKSCFADNDCYGRCAKDESFVCLTDADCKISSGSLRGLTSTAISPLKYSPYTMATCDKVSSSACSSFGWLSFNKADFPTAPLNLQTPPGGGTLGVSFNSVSGGLSGWARFMSPANDSSVKCGSDSFCSNDKNVGCGSASDCRTGWVRFRGANIAPPATGEVFGCHECDSGPVGDSSCQHCQDDSGHSCQPSITGTTAACHYTCGGEITNDPTHYCKSNLDCTAAGLTGQLALCKPPGRCSEDPALSCESDTTCSDANAGYCVFGAECKIAGGLCQAYGVDFDKTTNKFHGYAWSQDFGWMDYRGISKGGDRYLQTRLGDIYATGAIGKPEAVMPSTENCNATFLIRSATSITNFCSALGDPYSGVATRAVVTNPIPFPGEQNTYENILGRFDVEGMKKVVSDIAGVKKNKYGQIIVEKPPADNLYTWWDGQMLHNNFGKNVLGGKVYKVIGDATIDTPITFDNLSTNAVDSLASKGNGAGVLIVEGNLFINKDMLYGTTPIDDVRKLASLVIIVTGDVTIHPDVTNIAGNFYIIGSLAGSAGKLSTGASLTNPLTIRGVAIAKDFKFERTFAGTIEDPKPSELFINDGRIQSNPAPGMVDFVKALPTSVNISP